MKLLGLIGGVSPESTAIYYRLLNDHARRRLGGVHSARLLLWSFDFHLLDAAYRAADWDGYRALVVGAGETLKRAGAEALMICSNTTHLAAEAVREKTGLPLIHVVDALAAAIRKTGARRPLLLGTPFVMEGPFYRNDLETRFGVETLVPDAAGREEVRRIIFDELVKGEVSPVSKRNLLDIVAASDADCVILGCTELCMILAAGDFRMPVFDSTALHAEAACDFALAGSE